MNDKAPKSMTPRQLIAALHEQGYDAVLDNSTVVPLAEWSVPRKTELRLAGSTIRDVTPNRPRGRRWQATRLADYCPPEWLAA